MTKVKPTVSLIQNRCSWLWDITVVRVANTVAVKNPSITLDTSQTQLPSVSMEDWFQDPTWVPKSMDAQIPCIQWCKSMHTVDPRTSKSNGKSRPAQLKPVLWKYQPYILIEFVKTCPYLLGMWIKIDFHLYCCKDLSLAKTDICRWGDEFHICLIKDSYK